MTAPPPSRSNNRVKPHYNTTPEGSSPFTMWVGNIPSDATVEEATSFFTTYPVSSIDRATSNPTPEYPSSSAVISIFVIPRSHCAFVNYANDEQLQRAIKFFDGRHLRPGGMKIRCRVRDPDATRSGVVLQRDRGVHREWLKNQRISKPRGEDEASSDDDRQSTSTTSSILAQHFPIRYFILKALTQEDLQRSMSSGYWTTQKHNETILNRTYRTSETVYLIFGANKSGEFSGYARMTSPIPSNSTEAAALPPTASTSAQADGDLNDDSQPAQQRGVPFSVQWIQIGSVPFHTIRSMNNPWNNNRGVKISRDGTEIEPNVGKALLERWGPVPEGLEQS